MTSLENQLDLAERIRKRWQPEKREDSAVYYGPLIDTDKTYVGARNDVLDLLDVVDTLQAELTACRQMTQRLATEAGQGQLTAAELRTLAIATLSASVILDSDSDNDNTQELQRLAERVVGMAEDMDRAAPPCEHKTGIELWSDGKTTVTRCEWDCQRLLVSVTTPEGYSRVVAEVATEASDDSE